MQVQVQVRHSGQCLKVWNNEAELPLKASELHARNEVERGGQYERKKLHMQSQQSQGWILDVKADQRMACNVKMALMRKLHATRKWHAMS